MDNGVTEMADADLLAGYRRGDVQCLEELVRKYRRQLFGFIVNMTSDLSAADDVFQEVWFKAIRNIDKYRAGSFLAWLTRIARNHVIDRWRAKKESVSLDAEDEHGRALKENIEDPGSGPDENVAGADVAENVFEILEQLPLEQKEVVVMRVKEGLSFKEISEIQGVSINTALARMHYAIGKLRTMLQPENG